MLADDTNSVLNNNASDDNEFFSTTSTNDSNAINSASYNDDENISIEGLQFISEQDGYSYYEHVINRKKYCLGPEGFWYLWDEVQGVFQFLSDFPCAFSDKVDETTTSTLEAENLSLSNKKSNIKRREIPGITFDDKSGFPIFPKNSKGYFILPKDENDQPFFPLDENNFTIFPYDFDKKKWTFPVDDTDEPIFPRNELNKPLIPVDEIGRPIFPIDEKGSYVFPLDETNCPIPALTPNGMPVLPIDDFGNYIIPRDREGKPLIQITNDGIPMSLADYKQWKQYYRENAKKFYEIQQQQQQQQYVPPSTPAPSSLGVMFHPLNLQQNAIQRMSGVAMLQRSKRVRPEDIDLPAPVEESPSIDYYNAQINYINHINLITNVVEPPVNIEENAKALKRKKFLSAQLNFSKKVPLKTAIIGNENKKTEFTESQKENPAITKKEYQQDDLNYTEGSKLSNRTSSENEVLSLVDNKEELNNEKNNKKLNKKQRNRSSERSVESDNYDYNHQSNYQKDSLSSNDHTNEGIYLNSLKNSDQTIGISNTIIESKIKEEIIEGDNYVMEDMEMSSDSEFSQDESNKKQVNVFSQNNALKNTEESIKELDNVNLDNNDSFLQSKHANNEKKINFSNAELQDFDITQLNELSDLDFVKRLIKYTRRRYDDIKKRIADLEKERSSEKEKLKKLFEVETQIEERLGFEFQQSSD